MRCNWAGPEEIYIKYHDEEWGVPLHDDKKMFEFFCLEFFQAGLSWITILKKRENFRKAFDSFNPERVSKYSQKKIDELMENKGIIRNRLKILAAINNAQKYFEIQEEFGSFAKYLWSFVQGETIQNKFKSMKEVPATSPESDAMSKDLKKRGFKFVGSTICYALMQATGMVNDHLEDCFRYKKLKNP